MKKNFKTILALVLVLMLVLSFGLVACTTEVTLTKIELNTDDVKTDYVVGETFDTTGLVVTAVYSDNTTKTVTDYTYSPNGALTVSDTTVTITYQGKTATISITVVDNSSSTDEHVCEDVCEECGKCLTDCTDPVCSDKCQGHGGSDTPDVPEIPEIDGIDARWIGSWVNDDTFFDPTTWFTNETKTAEITDDLSAPELEEDGSLKITGFSRMTGDYMALRNESNQVMNPLHHNEHNTALIGENVVYSMLVKSEGHFGMLLFAASKRGWEDSTEYRAIIVEYNDGVITIKAQRPSDEVTATAEAEISSTEFTRVDFVFTRISDGQNTGVCEMRMYVGGELVELTGSDTTEDGAMNITVRGYGQQMEFVSLDEKALWIAAPAAPAEEEKTYEIDSTSMTLVVEDGKVYLTVSGTYSGYTEDEFKMDVQFVGGSWPNYGDWTNIVVLKDGTFTIKYDVTVAGPGEYVAHVFVDGESNDTGFNEMPANFGMTVSAGTVDYTLGTDEKGWGFKYTVTLTVVDTAAKEIKINAESFDLVAEGDKALVKITIETTGFDSDADLKAYLAYGNTDGAYEWKTDCYKVEKVEDGVYNVYFDITDMVAGGDGQLWSNLYLNGVKTEIKDPAHTSNGKSITVGGKTYTVVCTGANGTWDIPCVKVA